MPRNMEPMPLWELRDRLGLSQEEMAVRLKVSQGFLSKVENAQTFPDDVKPWVSRYRAGSQKFFRECWYQGFALPLWQFSKKDGEPMEIIDCRASAQKERPA